MIQRALRIRFICWHRLGRFILGGAVHGSAVIASQALISGAFSLTIQAIQLGYLPRLLVKHTSSTERARFICRTSTGR